MADERKITEEKDRNFSEVSEKAKEKRDSGNPGGGAGRREDVRGSGVYPASGPLPKENAPYQGEESFGQGKRGEAGYEDSGDSEITYQGMDVDGKAKGPVMTEREGEESTEAKERKTEPHYSDAHDRRAKARKKSE